MSNADRKPQTLVEEGTHLTGTLTSSCPVVVNGTIDGEFSAPQLTVTQTGAVLGSIKVKKLDSQGTLSGDVEADEVRLAGIVKPSTVIKAATLEVKLTSHNGKKLEVTFGECVLEVGDEPGKSEQPHFSKAPGRRDSKPPVAEAAGAHEDEETSAGIEASPVANGASRSASLVPEA